MALSDSEKIIKNELKSFVKEWRTKHPSASSGVLKDSDLIEFVNDLQTEILHKTSFIPRSGNKLILYSGKNSNGEEIWKEVEYFCKQNPDYYYISSTEAGKILWENDFKEAVINAIGDRAVAERVLSGKDYATNKRISKFAIEGTDILAMDDFISKTLTEEAINSGNKVVYVAGKGVSATDKKVGILTELPCVISEKWIGKTFDEAMATKFVAVDDLNKLLSSDLSEYSDIFIRNSNFLLDDEGIIRGVHLEMNDFPSIDVGKTSGYALSVNYGSKLGILTDPELLSKYSFLNDSVSQSILDEFRVGEYKLKTTGVDTLTSKNLYFDNNGLLLSIEKKVPNSVFETTIGEIRNYISDAEMELKYKGYEKLSAIDKIKSKQIDLNLRKLNTALDSVEVSDDILSKYLKAVGKTEDTLGLFDKQIVKILSGKLSGNQKVSNAIVSFTSTTSDLAKGLKTAIPYIDMTFTMIDFVQTVDKIKDVYETRGIEAAKESVKTEVTRFIMGNAMAWGAGELSAYILGVGLASGPIGTLVAIAAVGIICAFSYVAVQEIMTNDDFVNNFWKPMGGSHFIVSLSVTQAPIGSGYVEKIVDDWGINYINDNDNSNMIYGMNGDDEIHGNGGNDYIDGGDDNDWLYGDDGDDIIYGGYGFDTIYGGSGNDFLYGDTGENLEFGSLSNDFLSGDTINGGDGHDYIFGEGGNDLLIGGNGIDYIYGGDGNDIIYGDEYIEPTLSGDVILPRLRDIKINFDRNDFEFSNNLYDSGANMPQSNYIFGGNGNDTIYGGVHSDIIFGGEGDDIIYGGDDDTSDALLAQFIIGDYLCGDEGNDIIFGGFGNDVIFGGADNDELHGESGDDEIWGEDGNDEIYGEDGNDKIFGGEGNDKIYGGEGDDYIDGGNGDDYIEAGNGKNIIFGGNGVDQIYGGEDDDYIEGGDDQDFLHGGNGNNIMYGQEGDDFIYGGNDKDYIYGGTGNDHLYGGNGENEIYGGHGDDVIYDGDDGSYIEGSFGNDIIYAGGGDDYIDPGEGDDYIQDDHGDDTIVFKAGYGTDTISDAAGNNTILLSGLSIETAEMSRINGSDLKISFGADNIIIKQYFDGAAFQNFNINGTMINDLITSLNGSDSDDWMSAWSDSGVTLIGNGGNDTLYGGNGDDVLDGGAGNDWLYGGNGNDTYIFGIGYGNDTIEDWGGCSTVKFKDVNSDDVTISNLWDSTLEITINGTDDKLTINGYKWNQGGFTFEFADGAVGTVNKDTWELELNQPFANEESEEDMVQKQADMLNDLYADNDSMSELLTETGDTVISDVTDSPLETEETDEIAEQTDIQLMILIDNMSAFSDDGNISDGIDVLNPTEDTAMMNQVLAGTQIQ